MRTISTLSLFFPKMERPRRHRRQARMALHVKRVGGGYANFAQESGREIALAEAIVALIDREKRKLAQFEFTVRRLLRESGGERTAEVRRAQRQVTAQRQRFDSIFDAAGQHAEEIHAALPQNVPQGMEEDFAALRNVPSGAQSNRFVRAAEIAAYGIDALRRRKHDYFGFTENITYWVANRIMPLYYVMLYRNPALPQVILLDAIWKGLVATAHQMFLNVPRNHLRAIHAVSAAVAHFVGTLEQKPRYLILKALRGSEIMFDRAGIPLGVLSEIPDDQVRNLYQTQEREEINLARQRDPDEGVIDLAHSSSSEEEEDVLIVDRHLLEMDRYVDLESPEGARLLTIWKDLGDDLPHINRKLSPPICELCGTKARFSYTGMPERNFCSRAHAKEAWEK